jgi:hypothetical protein
MSVSAATGQLWLVGSSIMALDEAEFDLIDRRWPALHRLFLASIRPIQVSRAETAELNAWFRDEVPAPTQVRRPRMSVEFGADYERFADAWLSTTSRLMSGRRRAAKLMRVLRRMARQPRAGANEVEESLFDTYAHLVAALDNCGFMLWSLGSILVPSRFRSDPSVLRSISYKTAANRWIETFPATRSALVLRHAMADPVLGQLLHLRNLTSHRAVGSMVRNAGDHRFFDGTYFGWAIGLISGGDGLLMEIDEAAGYAHWVEKTVEQIATAVAVVVTDRLPIIEKGIANGNVKSSDEFVRLEMGWPLSLRP